jgi:hypothetical protein
MAASSMVALQRILLTPVLLERVLMMLLSDEGSTEFRQAGTNSRPPMPCFYLKPKQDALNQELQICIAEALYDVDSIVADPEAYTKEQVATLQSQIVLNPEQEWEISGGQSAPRYNAFSTLSVLLCLPVYLGELSIALAGFTEETSRFIIMDKFVLCTLNLSLSRYTVVGLCGGDYNFKRI